MMELKQKLALGLLLFTVGTNAQTGIWRADSIQEVVVTGTGTQHLLKNAPVQTEVISHRQLQQYAGKSIEDILSGLTASFDFSENDMSSRLQMNGLGNSYVLILIDGRRLLQYTIRHAEVIGRYQNDEFKLCRIYFFQTFYYGYMWWQRFLQIVGALITYFHQ